MLTHGGVLGRESSFVMVHVWKSEEVAIGMLMPVSALSVAKAHHVELTLMMQGSGKFWVMTGPFTERFTSMPDLLRTYSARLWWMSPAMSTGEDVPKVKSEERRTVMITGDLNIMSSQ